MIAFGLFLSILSEAMYYGTSELMFKDAIDMHIGSLQIHKKGYQGNKTLSYMFASTEKLIDTLKQEKDIQGWTKRIVGGGMVSVKDNTNVAQIIGIDPVNEAKITTLENKIINGERLKRKYKKLYKTVPTSRYLSAEPKLEAIIGNKLSEKLEAAIGDKLAVMVFGADGSIGEELYTIVGIYHTGYPNLDSAINIHINDAESLFSAYGRISEIVLSLPNSRVVPEVLDNLKTKIDTDIYEVLSWKEISPELLQLMDLKTASRYLFLFILLLIIGFGILNTVFMTIMERIRELGMLKSLGTSPVQIFGLIITETIFLALVGVIIGNIAGATAAYYLQTNPINLTSMSELYEEWGVTASYMTAELVPYYFISFNIIVFAVSVIAALYPAVKAARLKPVEALKHI